MSAVLKQVCTQETIYFVTYKCVVDDYFVKIIRRDLLPTFCARQFIDCLLCSQSSIICNRLDGYNLQMLWTCLVSWGTFIS